MSLTWLDTEGGPFIVVPRAALSHWSGTEGDYDRACEVTELVDILALSDGAEALVLGGEPLSTAHLPDYRLLVRWCYAESEDGIADIIRAGLPTAEWDEGPVLSTTGELVLFDAAYFGTEVGTLTDSAALELGPGRYRVDSASLEPDPLTSFLIHRFVELA
ncbi:Imm21 family immunity protein [Streptomyces sp. NPDC001523]|uniref:Imm21 family immunity protein n=1 Tax=Streptomyces sp. NPDC001523 TaxID=3154383 RepID=UPI0033173A4F